MSVVKDDLCKLLLENLQTEQHQILNYSLRILIFIFTHLRKQLSLQLQYFLKVLLEVMDTTER